MSEQFPLRALVIAPQPFFSPRGTPFSVYYRTLILSELGVGVDLLTYGQGQDVDLPGVNIIRIPDFPFLGRIKTGPSGLKLFLDGFMFLWTLGLLVRRRYDFVHAHEEVVFYCRYLKPLFRFKLLYDMHSSLPQQLDQFQLHDFQVPDQEVPSRNSRTAVAAPPRMPSSRSAPALADYVDRFDCRSTTKHLLIENSIFDPVRLKGAGGIRSAARMTAASSCRQSTAANP